MCKVIKLSSEEIVPLIEELLNKGFKVRIAVTGMSMYPFLRENIDSVELCNIDNSQVQKGDIVLIFQENVGYVLHRVVKKNGENFYISGDAQHNIEGPFTPKSLIAVVTAVWRKGNSVDCKSFYWRVLSSLWLYLMPLRPWLIRIYKTIRKLI